jgi:hypothetical protein
MTYLRNLLLLVVVTGGAAACSSSVKQPKSDGGRDAVGRDGAVHDGAVRDGAVHDGAAYDAGTRDARDAGGGDAGCAPLDVTTNCPGGPTAECQPTWPEALAHPLCMGTPVNLFPFTNEIRFDCGAYHVRDIGHADWGETYYYDIASGALVAIHYSAGLGRCFGGYQDARASCSSSYSAAPPVCTLYGGTFSNSDAGLTGDAGAVCAGSTSSFPNNVRLNAACPGDGGTDSGPPCYASCDVGLGEYKYVGCVSRDAGATTCHASCSECAR